MKIKILLIAAAIGLAGCVSTTVEPIISADVLPGGKGSGAVVQEPFVKVPVLPPVIGPCKIKVNGVWVEGVCDDSDPKTPPVPVCVGSDCDPTNPPVCTGPDCEPVDPPEKPKKNFGCNNGWGNNSQCAPGNSLNNNNAENREGDRENGTNDPNGMSQAPGKSGQDRGNSGSAPGQQGEKASEDTTQTETNNSNGAGQGNSGGKDKDKADKGKETAPGQQDK